MLAAKQASEDGTAYNGPMDAKTFKILNRISAAGFFLQRFKQAAFGNKTYRIFNILTERGMAPLQVKDALDYLEEQWPGHFIVAGAWNKDTGLQAGTAMDNEGNITGTPVYPIPTNALLQMMPDVWDEATEQFNPATELSDVILLMGQAPRRFI